MTHDPADLRETGALDNDFSEFVMDAQRAGDAEGDAPKTNRGTFNHGRDVAGGVAAG